MRFSKHQDWEPTASTTSDRVLLVDEATDSRRIEQQKNNSSFGYTAFAHSRAQHLFSSVDIENQSG
jgi:hypothetical protein